MTSKHYQHSRHRSALGEADPRHLSLPRLDRHAQRDRGARRRSARRQRHRSRPRSLHRPPASGRPDPARQRAKDPLPSSGRRGQNNVYRAAVKMDQDGVYHVAGVDAGPARARQRGFLHRGPQSRAAADRAGAPARRLPRPPHRRGDRRRSRPPTNTGSEASRCIIRSTAAPETTVELLKKKGEKQADGSTTLALEDFKLVPGDLVSIYATAKDANSECPHRHRCSSRPTPMSASFRNPSRPAAEAEAAEEARR